MIFQQSFDQRSESQYAGHYGSDHEYSPFKPGETITSQLPSPTHDAVQSIRTGLRDVASETARNIQQLSQATVEQALEIGQQLWRMQRDLNRKEYGVFLSILGWATTKARKFINLAKTFEGFEQSQLIRVELTTLLGLCSSRYSSVVARLRETKDITQQLVEELIKQNRPERKPKQDPISGWKQNRVGGTRRYEVILHDEETGLSIEQQAEESGVLPQRVIAEAVALRAKQKSADLEVKLTEGVAASSTETDIVQEHAQSRLLEVEELAPTEIASAESQQPEEDTMPQGGLLEALAPQEASELLDEVTIAQREVEQYLEEQATQIAVLPEGAVLAGENETEIQWLLNAPLHSVEEVIRSIPVRSAYRTLYLLNQFQSGDTKRMELLEQRVTEHHVAIGAVKPGQVIAIECTEDSSQTPEATGCSEAELESSYLEPTTDNEYSVELEEDAQELEPEPQVIHEDDKQSASDQAIAVMWKTRASELGLILDYTTIGEYAVRHNGSKLGAAVQKWGSDNNSWWENMRQVSSLRVKDGDGMRYDTPEEAAIALAKLMRVIDEGSSASADLCGGWESSPSHFVEEHADFLDDVNQEVQSLQPVGAVSSQKAKPTTDPNGSFDF